MTKEFVTTDYLDERLNLFAKQIGDNISRAIQETIKQTSKESDEKIMKFEKEQTDRLIKVLDNYQSLTEKHERMFKQMKNEFEK